MRHRRALAIALCISVTVIVIEVIGWLFTKSLALLADATHLAVDSFGVLMALVAVTLAARPPTPQRTFGLQRAEMIIALFNAVLVTAVGLYILVTAIRGLLEPPEVASGSMLWFALVATAGNAVSVLLLMKGQGESLNVRGAFLEVLSDMLAAAATVVAALVMIFTGFQRADAIAAMLIGVMIIPRAYVLGREAVHVLMEGTPRDVDLGALRASLLAVPGVAGVHDLHAWTITSGVRTASAHITVEPGADQEAVLSGLHAALGSGYDIGHSTFQLEPAGFSDPSPGHR